jgi:PadR family transcriptional regulator AphA
MEAVIKEKNGKRYVAVVIGKTMMCDEKDAVELAGICGNNSAPRLLVFEQNLDPAFFDLSTCVAGNILQKFINYRIRVAAVIQPARSGRGKFGEMVIETNRGSDFRVYGSEEDALDWLLRV